MNHRNMKKIPSNLVKLDQKFENFEGFFIA